MQRRLLIPFAFLSAVIIGAVCVGCKTPPIHPPEPVGCGCALSDPLATPPYQDGPDMEARECVSQTESGHICRVCVLKPNGSWWVIGTLWRPAYTFNADGTFTCHCFNADGGRYHFLGDSGSQEHPEDIVSIKPDVPFSAGKFQWWEFRLAK